MAKAGVDYGELIECLEAVCSGQKPKHDYSIWIDLEPHVPASANKHLLAIATHAWLGHDLPAIAAWARWYVDRPLHESESLTGSGSYRKAIDLATYVIGCALLAGGWIEEGRGMLSRCAASIAFLALGAGTGPARKIRDQGTPGTPLLLVGDGAPEPVKESGGKIPFVAVAGKRSHVRARLDQTIGGSHFCGDFEYTSALTCSVLLAQALGVPYSAKAYSFEAIVFDALRRRWPEAPVWGLAFAERVFIRSLVSRPTDAATARQVAEIAANHPPALPVVYDRYEDGSIFAVMLALSDSSTGGRAIAAQRGADGTTYLASADTGGRGANDVKPQKAWETELAWCCQHLEGGPVFAVPKPSAARAWRADFEPGEGLTFIAGSGATQPQPEQPIPGNPTIPPPAEPHESSLRLNVRAMTDAECAATGSALGSFLLSANSAEATVKEIWPGAGADEARRWVIEP